MAFGYPRNEPNEIIDFSNYQKISVLVVFNPEGKMIPLYMSIPDQYDNIFKVKIDGIKQTKEFNCYITYCCLYNNGFRQQQIYLTYCKIDHIWIIKN